MALDTTYVLQELSRKGVLSSVDYKTALQCEKARPISVHWEVRILLGSGIALLSGGLGTLIYKHIESFGHMIIIGLIVLAIFGLARYVLIRRQPYTNGTASSYNTLVDYALLLACTLFLILEGYLQAQYQFFGERYGVATLIPAVLFFCLAYRFDHKGVLTMAITAFTAWAGCSWQFETGKFSVFGLPWLVGGPGVGNVTLWRIGIGVGCGLIAIGAMLHRRRIKQHFTELYYLIGFNMACIAGLTRAVDYRLFGLLVLGLSAVAIAYSRRRASPLFFVLSVIYAYVAFTRMIFFDFDIGWLVYGVISCAALVFLFFNYKHVLGIPQGEK